MPAVAPRLLCELAKQMRSVKQYRAGTKSPLLHSFASSIVAAQIITEPRYSTGMECHDVNQDIRRHIPEVVIFMVTTDFTLSLSLVTIALLFFL
jgi:hypothetical protein